MISERALQEIQDRLDIVELIGGYVILKKTGQNFKALCPFHPEKTPSFMVYPKKQFFICYGCHAGGDLITFVMRHEHLEFPEAVRLLAERAGVTIPEVKGSNSAVPPEGYRLHEWAAGFYHELLTKSEEAQRARDYLKTRGLEPSIWERFSLGYAPSAWDGLLTPARGEGFSPQVLERWGLAIRREEGSGWYDRFRDRVIFPIWDARGKVIGFGGRVVGDSQGPKYMNSPETELYVKGKVLYGLHLASPHIRERDFCLVVEGYMDLVSLFRAGIQNVVASMGTSLTETQVQLIRRHTRHVVMVYDGDYAGETATLRGLDLFLEAQMRVKVAALPSGADPDSLVRDAGVQALVEVIQKSQDLFDYKLGLLQRRWDPKELEGRMRICEEMLPTMKRVPNAIQRGEYVKRLSEFLRVEESLLWDELKRVKLHSAGWRPTVGMQPSARPTMSAEDLLAGLLLEEPGRIVQLAERLNMENLKDPDVQKLVHWLMAEAQGGSVPPGGRSLMSRLPRGSDEWVGRLAQWLAWADTVVEKEKTFEEVLKKIENGRRRASLDGLQSLIRQAEEQGDEGATTQLILEYNRLIKVKP